MGNFWEPYRQKGIFVFHVLKLAKKKERERSERAGKKKKEKKNTTMTDPKTDLSTLFKVVQ